jgi:uncharacterized membrane protein
VISILITDSFPLYELYHVLEGVLKVPLATMQSTATSSFVVAVVQVGSSTTTLIQMTLRQLYDLRRTVFYKKLMVPYLYSTLYQEVWNLYNDAPDTNCIYTTSITTYTSNGKAKSVMLMMIMTTIVVFANPIPTRVRTGLK